MFHVGEYVYVNPRLLQDGADPSGQITSIEYVMKQSGDIIDHYSVLMSDGSTRFIAENNLKSAEKREIANTGTTEKLETPEIMTTAKIRALKDALTRKLLKLIQDYEKTTGTHIADVHIDTATYEGDGTVFNLVTDVRLEIRL